MRFLSIISNGEIIDQIPTTLTDDQVIEIDDLLRKNGLLDGPSELEIAVTYDPEERKENILHAAIQGLQDYYDCLKCNAFVQTVKKTVSVPDTGNDHADYLNVKNQVEYLAQQEE